MAREDRITYLLYALFALIVALVAGACAPAHRCGVTASGDNASHEYQAECVVDVLHM